jgi:hypothetical protein
MAARRTPSRSLWIWIYCLIWCFIQVSAEAPSGRSERARLAGAVYKYIYTHLYVFYVYIYIYMHRAVLLAPPLGAGVFFLSASEGARPDARGGIWRRAGRPQGRDDPRPHVDALLPALPGPCPPTPPPRPPPLSLLSRPAQRCERGVAFVFTFFLSFAICLSKEGRRTHGRPRHPMAEA